MSRDEHHPRPRDAAPKDRPDSPERRALSQWLDTFDHDTPTLWPTDTPDTSDTSGATWPDNNNNDDAFASAFQPSQQGGASLRHAAARLSRELGPLFAEARQAARDNHPAMVRVRLEQAARLSGFITGLLVAADLEADAPSTATSNPGTPNPGTPQAGTPDALFAVGQTILQSDPGWHLERLHEAVTRAQARGESLDLEIFLR